MELKLAAFIVLFYLLTGSYSEMIPMEERPIIVKEQCKDTISFVPDPDDCAGYFNCSNTNITRRCPALRLYSEPLRQCRPFTEVHCMNRPIMSTAMDFTGDCSRIMCYVDARLFDPFKVNFHPQTCSDLIVENLISIDKGMVRFAIGKEDGLMDRARSISALRYFNMKLKLILAIKETKINLEPLLSDANKRRMFIESTKRFLNISMFDGIYLELQTISSATQKLLFEEFDTVFRADTSRHYIVYLFVSSTNNSKFDEELKTLEKYVDGAILKTYGFTQNKDSLTENDAPFTEMSEDVDKVLRMGFPTHKLIVHLALYGDSFHMFKRQNDMNFFIAIDRQRDVTTKVFGRVPFSSICLKLRDYGYSAMESTSNQNPYIFKGNNWITYQDEKATAGKVLSLKKKIGGFALYSLTLDDYTGLACRRVFPMLRTVLRACGAKDPFY